MKAVSLIAVFILAQFFHWAGLVFVLLIVFYVCQWYYKEGRDFEKFEKDGGTTIVTTITFTPSREKDKGNAHECDDSDNYRHGN